MMANKLPRLTHRARFLVDNLDLPAATGVPDARWEPFQLAHLCNNSLLSIHLKSRQVAWSFTSAAEAIANAFLYGIPSSFVSINENEAKRKIRYARLIEQNIKLSGLPNKVRDNELMLEYNNGAQLISLPSKATRGPDRMWLYLDEFAHVQHDVEIFRGSLPAVSKGGKLRIGSSPFGANGRFWEVFTESLEPYPDFVRYRTPWWETFGLCLDPKRAYHEAPYLTTYERVERFAKESIVLLCHNMPLEDFQQEFECEFGSGDTSWISWEEIKAAQERVTDLTCFMATCTGAAIGPARQAIDDLAKAIGTLELAYAAGVDIGRTRNATEIYLVGLSSVGLYPLRLAITLNNADFPIQEDVLAYALATLPISNMLIDNGGLGRQLASGLATRFPSKVQEAVFSNATKTLWATEAKMLFQQNKVALPVDRDLAYQIHSIKRLITPSKNLIFDTARNEKHHADKFWALVLALYLAKQPATGLVVGSRVVSAAGVFG